MERGGRAAGAIFTLLIFAALGAGCARQQTNRSDAPDRTALAFRLPDRGLVTGTLWAVDPTSQHATVRAADGALYQVNGEHASVALNGQPASFETLKPGESVRVTAPAVNQLTRDLEASSLSATAGAARAPLVLAAKPAASTANPAFGGAPSPAGLAVRRRHAHLAGFLSRFRRRPRSRGADQAARDEREQGERRFHEERMRRRRDELSTHPQTSPGDNEANGPEVDPGPDPGEIERDFERDFPQYARGKD